MFGADANRVQTKVLHLVPRDGLGGVEAAVRSLRPEDHLELTVLYMAGPSILPPGPLYRTLAPKHGLGSPLVYWRALLEVLRLRPEVVVCSLWRATLIGLLAKVVLPRTKLVLMIHATTIAHAADRVITWLGCKWATEVWCDSRASKDVAQRRYRRCARSVSFRVSTMSREGGDRRPLDFVYWGRHAHIKDVPRAVRIFNRVLARCPEARLYVYGQVGPATEAIREAIGEARNPDAIRMMGAKPPGEYPDPIATCTFFLTTSKHEGMAVAVVEAMQLGLIPVVTPVGEIANYCVADDNSVVVYDDEFAAASVVAIASDERERVRLSTAAMQTWAGVPDYSTDFKTAYSRLLQQADPRLGKGANG